MLCVCMAPCSLQTAALLAVSPVGHRRAQQGHTNNTMPAAPCSTCRLVTMFSLVLSSTRFLRPQLSKAGQLSAGLSKQLCPSKEPFSPTALLSAHADTGHSYLVELQELPWGWGCHKGSLHMGILLQVLWDVLA